MHSRCAPGAITRNTALCLTQRVATLHGGCYAHTWPRTPRSRPNPHGKNLLDVLLPITQRARLGLPLVERLVLPIVTAPDQEVTLQRAVFIGAAAAVLFLPQYHLALVAFPGSSAPPFATFTPHRGGYPAPSTDRSFRDSIVGFGLVGCSMPAFCHRGNRIATFYHLGTTRHMTF